MKPPNAGASRALRGSRWLRAAVLGFLLVIPAAAARDDRPPEADAPAKVKPGTTALCTAADKRMRYFLRVPKKYDQRAGARLIVFLHGSNMNGLEYLRSFEAKKWCDDDILCCPNGETGTGPFDRNNFGFQSGPLVADVTREVQKAFNTTITYIGGHSQGGFLAYSVILNFPDLYRGAFPMAADCWSQNEPNLWEGKPGWTERQRKIAIAVIHGKADPVVAFSQGEHAYDCFRAMGWTRLRLLAPAELDHMFMLAPVDEAIEWLDAMNGRGGKRSLALASKWARAGEWGWVWNTAKASAGASPALVTAAEEAAAKAVPAMTELLKRPPPEWVPKWVEFWRVHGDTNAAKTIVAGYLRRRDQQRDAASRLFNESQALFRSDKRDDAFRVLERLRDEGPCTYQGYFAYKWLSEKP